MEIDFTKSHRAMDIRQHEGTYSGFVKLMIASSALIVVILVGMALFLT